MPSSTTLYTSPGNAGNVASKNFTTLYSGSGSINPTQPYGNANVVGLLAASTDGANTIGVISATGNIVSDAFFIGNGSQLTGVVAASVNANALIGNTLSPNVLFSSLTSVGTLSNVSVSGTVTAGTIAGNGSLLTNIPGANVTGVVANATFANTAVTVTGNAQANITSVGVLTSLSSTGNITAPYFLGNVVGNITGNIVVGGANTEVLVNNNGNIGPSPGLTFDNSSNVLSTSGSVTAVGNIQGNYFLGNGSQLTGLPATYGNADVVSLLAAFGSNVMSTTGNVTAGYFIGNGSQLTGLPAGYSNADVATFMANFGSNSISTSGNVTTGNITVTTDAVVQGNLTVNGNTTFINSNVVTINDKFINVANNAATAAQANGGGLGVGPVGGEYATLEYLSTPNVWATNIGLSVTGNVSAGNISATGNTATGGLLTDNYYYANGTPISFAGTYSNANVVSLMAAFGSNSISTSGNVTAGNVTGAFIVGDGSLLSNITGANVTGTVANATFAASAGTASTVTGNAQANITSVGVLTSLSVTGNTATGGIKTDNYYYANGTPISFAGTYGNANVVSLMAAFGSNTISTSGNVTAGNLALTGGMQITGSIVNSAAVNKQVEFLGAGAISTGQVKFGTGSALLDGTANTFIQTAASGANLLFGPNDWTIEMFVYPTVAVSSAVFYDIGEVGSSGDRAPLIAYSGGNLIFSALNTSLISSAATVTANTWNHIAAARSSGNTKLYLNGVQVGSTYADTINYNEGGAGNLRVGSSTLTASGSSLFTGYVDEVRISNGIGRYTGSTYTVPTNPFSSDTYTALLLHCDGANGSTIILDSSSTSDVTVDDNLVVTGDITFSGLLYGDGSELTNITANTATTAVTVTGNAQANITSVGTLTSLSVTGNTTTGNILTAGIVSATGNVTGNYILGNGSQLTGLPATYGNADVVSLLAAFGSNTISTSGNVTSGNVLTGGVVSATGNVVGGNINTGGGVFVTGAVSAVGNVRGGNINTVGLITATGNVTGNYFIGNGSQLTGITTSAGGSNTQIQYNNGGVFAGNAAMTFENVTGNIGLGNLIVGSSTSGNGNIGGSAQRINTIAPFTGIIAGTISSFGNGQIVIGNGYFGNLNVSLLQGQGSRSGKLVLWDSANVAESGGVGIRYSGIQSTPYVSLSSNIANSASQISGGSGTLHIGGGSAGNIVSISGSSTNIFGQGGLVFVGQPNTTVALGNTTVSGASGLVGRTVVTAGSVATVAVGVNAGAQGAGNTVNQIGVSSVLQSGNTSLAPSKAYAYYMGPVSGSASAIGGIVNNNASRIAAEYYFLRNDDAVAQTQLGTLRSYNEYNSVSATTSGALTIDKAVSQVHQVNLAGNITSVTYANMVSSLSDSVNTDEEVDTVTIIFNQGATGGYSVALPTGSTYKYAGGGNTVSTAANSVTLVAVTVVRIGGTATYLTTVSPGFV